MIERISFERGSLFFWPVCQIQSADFNFLHVSSLGLFSPLEFRQSCDELVSLNTTKPYFPALYRRKLPIWVLDQKCLPQQLEIASSAAGRASAVLFTDIPEYHQTKEDIERLLVQSKNATSPDHQILSRVFLPPIIYLAKKCRPLEKLRDQITVSPTYKSETLLGSNLPFIHTINAPSAVNASQQPVYRSRPVTIDVINNDQWLFNPDVGQILPVLAVAGLILMIILDVVIRRLRKLFDRNMIHRDDLLINGEGTDADVSANNSQSEGDPSYWRPLHPRKHLVLLPFLLNALVMSGLSLIYSNDYDSIICPILLVLSLSLQFLSYMLLVSYMHYSACGINVTVVTDSIARETSRMYLALLFSSASCLGATATNCFWGLITVACVSILVELSRKNLKFLHIKKAFLGGADMSSRQLAICQRVADNGIKHHRFHIGIDMLWVGCHVYVHCTLDNRSLAPIIIFMTNILCVVAKVVAETSWSNPPAAIFFLNYKYHEEQHEQRKVLRVSGAKQITELGTEQSRQTVLFISPETDRPCRVHAVSPPSNLPPNNASFKLHRFIKNYLRNVFLNEGPVNFAWFESGIADAHRVRRAGSIDSALRNYLRRHDRLILRRSAERITVLNPFDYPDQLEAPMLSPHEEESEEMDVASEGEHSIPYDTPLRGVGDLSWATSPQAIPPEVRQVGFAEDALGEHNFHLT